MVVGGDAEPAPGQVKVVATAGHVDHGKSSLIMALTDIDPDRWDEEKRRGLTIDLGYAWCELPSGREVGFVDVPGHERFITNMLAGVGPAPAVLFVVAADEGWKPQSEEHLEIIDVLGIEAGVVALTRSDLIEPGAASAATQAIRVRLEGTSLGEAPIVPVSARTGAGMDELRDALDAMLASIPAPEPARTRLFVDRVFTIKGSGTVITGTLTGGCLVASDEVQIEPAGLHARVRSLQTHGKAVDRACPVSRVAVNLAGIDRDQVGRGDVLTRRREWDPTGVADVILRPVRGLEHAIGARGAYKVYAGAAEADATIRLLGSSTKLEPTGQTPARVRTSRPLVLDPFDRIVIREAGRRETVAGGVVLDVAPPRRAGPDREAQLTARVGSTRDELAGLMAAERGAVRADTVVRATGSSSVLDGTRWCLRPGLATSVEENLRRSLEAYHLEHPLEEGDSSQHARSVIAASLRAAGAPADPDLCDELLARFVREGSVATSTDTVRVSDHEVALESHSEELDRLVAAIGGEHETTPPTIKELLATGFDRSVIDAAAREGQIVKISPDLVVTPTLIDRAGAVVSDATDGITVSSFREALGTTRKYAVPMLEHFDRSGLTRRDGDLRFPR